MLIIIDMTGENEEIKENTQEKNENDTKKYNSEIYIENIPRLQILEISNFQ